MNNFKRFLIDYAYFQELRMFPSKLFYIRECLFTVSVFLTLGVVLERYQASCQPTEYIYRYEVQAYLLEDQRK